MVVSVLIITCFLKLAACNPYLSTVLSGKPTTSITTNDPPVGYNNQVPDLQVYNSYSYNIPQETTQPVEQVKVNNLNKLSRPMTVTPPPTPESYRPDKNIQNDYVNINVTDSAITKLLNDNMEAPKYQHKPYSKTFNNFRDNLLKTIDLSLKNKLPISSASENIKTVDTRGLSQIPKFTNSVTPINTQPMQPKDNISRILTNNNMIKGQQNVGTKEEALMPVNIIKYKGQNIDKEKYPENGKQISPLTTQHIQPKDNLPENVINNNMFKGQQILATKDEVLMPNNSVKYKDHTKDKEKYPENGKETSRVLYNNNVNPFIQTSKDKNLGKINTNIQPRQDIKYSSRNVVNNNISQMQPISAPSSKIQEYPPVVPTSETKNPNFLLPYKEERNLSQPLKIPYNKWNPLNSTGFNQQLTSDDQTLRENHILRTDPNSSLQLQTSRFPYYNNNMLNTKLFTQPLLSSNQSLQVDPFVKIQQSYSPQENISDYKDRDKSVSQMKQLNFTHPNQQGNVSAIANSDIIEKPALIRKNEEGNLSQIFGAPYFNNFYQPNSRAFSQQFIPGNQLLKEDQLETVDPKYDGLENNVSLMPYLLLNQKIPPEKINPGIISQSTQVLHNHEGNVTDIVRTPHYNNYQHFARESNQQIIPNNQFLTENQLVKADLNNGLHRNENQMPSLSVIPSKTYENPLEHTGIELVNTMNEHELTVPSHQILQKNQFVITDPSISPQQDINNNSQNNNVIHVVPQISVLPTIPQKNSSEVSTLGVENKSSPPSYKKESNETQIFRDSYFNELDQFNEKTKLQLTSNNQVSKENQLVKIEPLTLSEINIKETLPINIVTHKNESEIQPLGVFPSNPQKNTSHVINTEISVSNIYRQPTLSVDKEIAETEPYINLNLNGGGRVSPQQQPSELPYQPQDNFPEFLQLIDDSENMRTKNAISIPAYNPEPKDRGTQIYNNGNIFENEYQRYRMSHNNRFNLINSRGLNQQVPPYNQILKDNTQSLKTNENILPQDTNYRVPNDQIPNEPQIPLFISQPQTNQIVKPNQNIIPQDSNNSTLSSKIPNKNELQMPPLTSQLEDNHSAFPMRVPTDINQIKSEVRMPLFTPQQDRNSILPTYSMNSTPNERMNSEVAKPLVTADAKNPITSPAHNGSVLGYEPQVTSVPYYNSFDNFISNARYQQTLHSSAIAKDNISVKPNQGIMPQNSTNITPSNKITNKTEPQIPPLTSQIQDNHSAFHVHVPTDKIPNENEFKMPLFTSKPQEKNAVPSPYSLNSSPKDARMNSEVVKPLGAPDAKNPNPSPAHSDSVPGYDPQISKVPYYNSFDPFISNAFNQQTLYSSPLAIENQLIKPSQGIMPLDSNNITPSNKMANINETQISPLTSQLHDNHPAFPMRCFNNDPENPQTDSKVTMPSDTPDPKNLQNSPGDVGSVYEPQISREPYYNSFHPFLNALNHQTLHNNEMAKVNKLVKSDLDHSAQKDVNNVLRNDDVGTESGSPILQKNISSPFQEKLRDSPIQNLYTNQGNTMVKNEITNLSDAQKPKQQNNPYSHDDSQLKNECQTNRTPYFNNFNSFNSDVLNQKLSHDNQVTKEDPSNKLTKSHHNTLLNLDMNISNADYADKNFPIEITITETSDESCIENDDNTSTNIIIDLHTEKDCTCFNSTQTFNNISSNVDVFIPCFTDEIDLTKENNSTISTVISSKLKEIIEDGKGLDNFSSYLADTILSAVRSFLIQSNSLSANNCGTENIFKNDDGNVCCSKPKVLSKTKLGIPLLKIEKNISESKESTQCIEKTRSSILCTNSTKNEGNEVKNDTESTPELNLSSDENPIKTSMKCPALNTTVLNEISSFQGGKNLLPGDITHTDSCECCNKIPQISPNNVENPDSYSTNLESVIGTHKLCISSKEILQVLPVIDNKSSNTNKNNDTPLNQTSQILLPYYYYTDKIMTTSNERSKTIPNSDVDSSSEEEERNDILTPASDPSTTPTTTDDNAEVRRPCGPKPCLSKITINILPIAEKNNHDILLFL